MEILEAGFNNFLRDILSVLYPNLPLYAFIPIAISLVIGLPGTKAEDEASGSDILLWRFRVLSLTASGIGILLMLIFPFLAKSVISSQEASKAVSFMMTQYWLLYCIGLPLLLITIFLLKRYLRPLISSIVKSLRVTQKEEKLSDIRDEMNNAEPHDFHPRDHYKENKIFTGLDQKTAKPTYTDHDVFFSTHKIVVGATRFGKGLTFQSWLDQSIKNGNAAIYIDPKGDEFLPVIMQEAAEAVGKKMITLDLNDNGRGTWGPIHRGTLSERRERIVELLKLEEKGTDADHYKTLARTFLENIIDQLDKEDKVTSLTTIIKAVKNSKPDDATQKALISPLARLERLEKRRAFKNKKNSGFDIERSLENGAIVYVRGSLMDDDITLATQILITEILQVGRRLKDSRQNHLSLYIDEVKFLISETITKALAVAANANIDISLAFQNFGDLTSPQDRNLDGEGILQSVLANCQIKLIFGGTDAMTAEQIAKMSGTSIKHYVSREMTNIDKTGAETWEGNRMYDHTDEALITENTVLSLSKRNGVLFEPSKLAAVISVAPIITEATKAISQKS